LPPDSEAEKESSNVFNQITGRVSSSALGMNGFFLQDSEKRRGKNKRGIGKSPLKDFTSFLKFRNALYLFDLHIFCRNRALIYVIFLFFSTKWGVEKEQTER
jgi:hypothetical protein